MRKRLCCPARRLDPSPGIILTLGAGLSAICILFYLLRPSVVEYLQLAVTDRIVAKAEDWRQTQQITIVDIDEKTLANWGQWPWPRFQLARLLNEIRRLGAASVALDFILAEPDRTSLKALQDSVNRVYGYRFDSRHFPRELLDNDATLAQTLSTGPFVLGFNFLFDETPEQGKDCTLHPLELARGLTPTGDRDAVSLFEARGRVCNLPQFDQAVSFSGFLNGRPDIDGRLRRLPLLIRYGGMLYPNLALAALLPTASNRTLLLRQNHLDHDDLVVAGNAIPLDENGNVRLNLKSEPSPLRRVSADWVMSGKTAAADIQNKIVFVGLTASGLTATYQTAAEMPLSAVEVHAQLAETILGRKFIRQPPGILCAEVLAALGIAFLYSFCISRLEFARSSLLGVAGILGLWEGASLLFRTKSILFSPLLPAAVILTTGVCLIIVKYWFRQKSARLGMQEALLSMRDSEGRLSSILNTIPDVVFRLDTAGRITFISPAVTKYGKSPEELIGRHIVDLVVPEDRESATHRLSERRTSERATHDFEVRLLLAGDGQEKRYFSVTAEGIYAGEKPDAGSFLGTQGIARDIDQRKRLECQLAQSRKMEAMGSLAAGVAHDLNNILSGIVGYPELLLMDLPHDSPMRPRLRAIQQSGQRAAAIVQDMLTIARRGIQAQDIFNLNETIRAYLGAPEFEKLSHRYPHIAVRTELSNDLMNIKGSAVQLSKAIMNLVANSAEAMPAGGKITLTTLNRYLDTELHAYENIPEGEYVLLSVTDEGIGITPEDVSRIFEPFYSKKKMDLSGSGLGMTVVWNTVKDHAGFLDIQSREGEGTHFDIYLPATREERDKSERRVVLQDFVGSESILVVDDIPQQLDIAVRMLSKLGYRVASAPSGEQAVAFLQTHAVDLLVLDMLMPPGIDGLETFQRIRAANPSQKAIIASGYAESERVEAMLNMGAGAYIRKPYTLEKIGLAVRRELDRK